MGDVRGLRRGLRAPCTPARVLSTLDPHEDELDRRTDLHMPEALLSQRELPGVKKMEEMADKTSKLVFRQSLPFSAVRFAHSEASEAGQPGSGGLWKSFSLISVTGALSTCFL